MSTRCISWNRLKGIATTITVILLLPAAASSQDASLWLPGESNAVLVVDVAAAYRSPLAQKEQWVKRAAQAFVSQEMLLPPSASRVTIGAQLDLGESLAPVREHIVLDLKPGTDLNSIAAISGGTVEQTGQHRGLASGNRFIIEAQPQRWLMVEPGGRQAGSRWVRSGAASSSRLSPILKQAIEGVSDQYPIVTALDVGDAVEKSAAKAILQELPGSPLKGSALDTAAGVLSSVKGIICRVHLGSARTLQCRIEFGQSAAPLGSVAMPLVQTVLNNWGASLEDATAWKSEVDGYALVFNGELSQSGMKRLLSIVHPPIVGGDGSGSPGEDQPAATIAASRKYLHSVQHELDDLRATVKKTRDNHALWFERAARTIDGLPLKNVDQDLQTFGGRVGSSLRYQSQALRMSNIQRGTRLAQTQANTYFSGIGPYGEVYRNVSGGNAPAIAAEEGQAAASVKFSEWKQIEDGLATIRRTLTNKYKEEF